MNFRKNVLTKKAWRYGASVPRAWTRSLAKPGSYLATPPVLANSFPKSGTHLLSQVLAALPGLRDWGNFWASTPSFTLREANPSSMARAIGRVAPNELICGHLFYSPVVAESLIDRNVVHYFIYRDPRDVVVSEAYYLANMNRWHKMHSYYSRLSTRKEQILLSIEGLSEGNIGYANIAGRFERYEHWLAAKEVCSVAYEDMTSERQSATVRRILEFYRDSTKRDLDLDQLCSEAETAIQPSRSHTFRKGGSGGWRKEFDEEIKVVFKEVAGDLLIRLGYEKDMDW